MARLFKYTSILVLFFMLSACAASAAAQADAVHLTTADAGKTVVLKPGDSLDITLEGNPSTGYTWETTSQDLKTLKQNGEIEALPAKDTKMGASQMLVLHFSAVSAGQETLKLVYHRPWEKGVEPASTFEINITVQ
jgi:inhibitor of cysteine peptidase